MTAEMAPGQAGATTGGPTRKGQQPSRVVRYGIWLAILARALGDRRFQANVITRAIGAYALVSVIKNNQAAPVRRAIRWYNVKGQVHSAEVLHHARRAVKATKR
jgi:hypothetical protein